MTEAILDAASACDAAKVRDAINGLDVNAPLGERGHPLLHTLLWEMREDCGWSDQQVVTLFTVLREIGVDANALDADGKSPLFILLSNASEFGNVAKQLVAVLGADPNLPVVRDQCLECALDTDYVEGFDLLLELGCQMPRDGRYTHLLFFYGEKDSSYYPVMLERLVGLGLVNVDERDDDLDTPLHCAMMRLDCKIDSFRMQKSTQDYVEEELAKELASILLDRGADPLAKNRDGRTPLDIWNRRFEAVDEGVTDDVEELLANAMADALDRIDAEKFYAFANESKAGAFLGEHVCTVLIRPLVMIPHPRGLMSQRRERIVAMLGAEGIAADGCYFTDCLLGTKEVDMREFRLRHYIATTGAAEYERIVRQFRRGNGGRFFSGIHAEARAVFKNRLMQRGVRFDVPIVAEDDHGAVVASSEDSFSFSNEEEEEDSSSSSSDDWW